MAAPDSLPAAIDQIRFARQYTLSLLEGLEPSEWYQMPDGVTHIAWQVGHLAMAQYGLCLFRMRGRQPRDAELMSSRFRKRFMKGSTPDPVPENHPTPAEILDVLERVHARAMDELPHYSCEDLQAPEEEPYVAYPDKLGSLLFCAAHEMLHAGQIGLLRRLLGKAPLR